MITDQDVQKIITAGSQVFATKAELAGVEKRLDSLEAKLEAKTDQILTAVDAYAKKADTFFQELVVATHRLDRHEMWIKKIAEKLGVALEF